MSTGPSSFDGRQSQRKDGAARSVSSPGFICGRALLGATQRMCLDVGEGGRGKTLIAGHLTYPFPQLDVQPATVNGKWLSEGRRLDMQSADCALVLCCR